MKAFGESEDIRPFSVDVPALEIDELKDRLRRARMAEKETVGDWSQGVPRADMDEMRRQWLEDYDWRRVETELNATGQWLTRIDGLDFHFIHARSERSDALPLLITHGWPGSVRSR